MTTSTAPVRAACSLPRIYHAASGDAGPRRPGDGTPTPFGMASLQRGPLHDLPEPTDLPAWLARDLCGGLDYYRKLDRNWQLQASLEAMRVEVPALFAIGGREVGLSMPGMKRIIATMPTLEPRLRPPVTIGDAGHRPQQERADTVHALILSFVASLDNAGHRSS